MAKPRKTRSGPPLPGEIVKDDLDIKAMVADAGEGVEPSADEATILRQDKMAAMGHTLALKLKKWLEAKAASGVERRWGEDLAQYTGDDETSKRVSSMMESAREGYPVVGKGDAKPQKSSVVVNITRSKTNAAEARLADMLLPTDDQNWGIKPTPVPELTAALDVHEPLPADANGQAIQVPVTDPQGNGQAGPDGQPVMRNATRADLAQAKLEAADKACESMSLEIQDQLEECSYNTEARIAVHNAAVLGTGILKGPIVTNQVRRAWTRKGSAWVMELLVEKKPMTVSVSPWNVVVDPACGDHPKNGSGMFEVRYLPERGIRELAKQPGYDKAALLAVIEEGPRDERDYTGEHEKANRQKMGSPASDKTLFGVWEYWGSFEREDLEAAGVALPPDEAIRQFDGCVVIINSTVVKAFLNPLESGELPYDFFQWERADGTPWGYGVPFLMRTPQRVLNAAWRQAMDNAGMAVGPQIIVKPGIIQPADKQWTISGKKVWWCTDDTADVTKAFTVHEFNMHLEEIEKLIALAMKFADEETSIPLLAQGEKGNAPDTVGGMTILMNSANVVLRRLVKQFDDLITRPHITRYYEWNMLFNPKDDIKGDFSVDARGSSTLLVKDTQNQALLQLGQFMANSVISPMVNWDEWFRETLKANHIDGAKILKTPEEIKKAQAQQGQAQPAPAVQAAQIRAQSAEKIAAATTASDHEIEKANIESAERIEHSRQILEQQLANSKNQNAIAVAMITERLTDKNLQSVERQVLEKIRAELAKESMRLTTQKDLAAATLAVDVHKHHNPPVEEPPVQVPGRAADGQAFTQVG